MKTENAKKGVILLVDDTPTNLGVLFDFLADSGFKVLVACDGESAIEKAEYALPDLILLDVVMPGIDGFETCRRLKANEATKDIPIIFMTALSDPTDKVRGLNIGAVDYITKPFQQEEVLARVTIQMSLCNLAKKLQAQNECLQHEIKERAAAERALLNLTLELEQRVEQRTSALSEANRLLTQSNERLQQEIQERLSAEAALLQSEAQLRTQAHDIERALLELQQAQSQLIQSEKMSSLGQLVAGVAHEINNPVSFIYGNLDHANLYSSSLLELLHLYQAHYPEPALVIQDKISEIDLDFLIEDLPKLLASMKIGAERIREIVLSLRKFSRLDESDMKPVDIHEGLENTLLILQNRIRDKVGHSGLLIVKDYGNLPEVECYAGQLNQVFMNILSNALDALDEYDRKRPVEEIVHNLSTIRIHTAVINSDRVTIQISDNGPGMTEDVCRRLFDPFFTTKPVGSGTGLGLSISYQIVVKKHGGTLKCVSTPGEGSLFIIEIPIHQQAGRTALSQSKTTQNQQPLVSSPRE
ncbi:response regulator [Microcoleus sp. FACHB-68]|uniref:hybrid sensor histidine kinase/response regulator n=1 Tax=Microcoleus sp. FACHB-68 TaxID=2692826 RepID=UPI001683BA50|nr:response regulator [Microcoleus sp. FACHB-68]MBD1935870.1 response regulator [Microcoleus sp. FACHB-68]